MKTEMYVLKEIILEIKKQTLKLWWWLVNSNFFILRASKITVHQGVSNQTIKTPCKSENRVYQSINLMMVFNALVVYDKQYRVVQKKVYDVI